MVLAEEKEAEEGAKGSRERVEVSVEDGEDGEEEGGGGRRPR